MHKVFKLDIYNPPQRKLVYIVFSLMAVDIRSIIFLI